MTEPGCASSRGASVRPSGSKFLCEDFRGQPRDDPGELPFVASRRNPVYRWQGGVDFLMVVSQNFRYQGERDGVFLANHGICEGEGERGRQLKDSSVNILLIFYLIVHLTVHLINSFFL